MKYEIDGRDPKGYVGCLWSICGVHDQVSFIGIINCSICFYYIIIIIADDLFKGWRERPVFGKIMYMNNAGCKRKFDVDGYIAYVKSLVNEMKKKKLDHQVIL
ncbi:deoxyribodipyrimidine photo-lyase-like isoform X1 [Mercurialis annua]|uniref:deoxyribodipyrimidine photo-lyase-like isoform X1 n=1 Tax=Mercurialis annua TaxID=3986 RepID=UPI0024AF9185|nr:deoxyribodipyrimidine photo-lyase-like isoform X1 [Mercurialis annua]